MNSLEKTIYHYKSLQAAILSSLSAENLVCKNFSSLVNVNKPFKLLSVGKASIPMLKAVPIKANICEEPIKCCALSPNKPSLDSNFFILQGNHPIPSKLSFCSTDKILQFISSEPKVDLVVLLSGGTSALFSQAPNNFLNSTKSALHKILVNSGLPINDINTVRRHFSNIKGGKLLRNNIHNSIHTTVLAISDVPNACPNDIGSGPFSPDSTTFADALRVAQTLPDIPNDVFEYLKQGRNGIFLENIKPDEVPSNLYSFNVLLDQEKSLASVSSILEQYHYQNKRIGLTTLFNKIFNAEVQHFTKDYWYYSIGEREINLPKSSSGKGGRITHGLLQLASKLYKAKLANIHFDIIGIATDGNDGSSESGGGFINSEILTPIIYSKMQEAIKNFHSACFMDTYQLLFPSSPAQTNVGDVFLLRLRSKISFQK